ncbi:hypothetical protein D3C81_2060400 [compost metagenome]
MVRKDAVARELLAEVGGCAYLPLGTAVLFQKILIRQRVALGFIFIIRRALNL